MFREEDPETSCYCIKKATDIDGNPSCYLDGLLDLTSCFGVPLLASFPHFLYADEKYVSGVDGLEPIIEKHTSFADIEPNTGSPLRGTKRMQFNMVIRPVSDPKANNSFLGGTENMRKVVLPILWVEEGVEIPDDLVEDLNNLYFNPLKILDIVKWVLIGVGAGVTALGAGALIYLKSKS